MNAKRPPGLPLDPSLHPTRKVESMSSIAAELMLKEQEGNFDEPSGRRLRSSRPPPFDGRPSRPEAWRPSAPPPPVAEPTARGPRVALLAGAAFLLVVASVIVTLIATR